MRRSSPVTTWPALRSWLTSRGFVVQEPTIYPNLAYIGRFAGDPRPEMVFLEGPGVWLPFEVIERLFLGLELNLEEFDAGALVVAASAWALPVSTTHVACGALFGLGAVNGSARWDTIGKIAAAWLVTLPMAAVLGATAAGVGRALLGA